jgi:hypothetical protein
MHIVMMMRRRRKVLPPGHWLTLYVPDAKPNGESVIIS